MAALSSLLVDLQVNTAALRKGLEDAKGLLSNFGKSLEGIGEQLHAFTELKGVEFGKEIIEGLGEFILKGNEATAQLGRLAAAAKVPVDEFSKLNYVAASSGVSTEELSKAFNKLNKNMGEAAAGAKEPAALFHALGVSVTDAAGHMRSSESVMVELAQKFDGMADDASKSTLEMAVFGKQGAQLEEMLRALKGGLGEAGDEAERLGLVITPQAAAAAKQFEEANVKLHMALTAVAQRTAADLAPSLSRLVEELLHSKTGSDALKEASEVLADSFRVVATVGIGLFGALREIGTAAAGVAAAFVAAASGDFAGEMEIWKATGEDLKKVWGETGEQIKAVWDKGSKGALDFNANLQPVLKSGAAILKQYEQGKQGLGAAEALKELTKVLDDYGKKAAELANAGDPLAEITFRLEKGDLVKALAAVGAQADEMKQKILAAAGALHELQMGKLSVQVDFQIQRAAAATSFDVEQRKRSFGQVGLSQADVVKQNEAGFASFEAALADLAKQTDIYNRKLGEAELLKLDGDQEAANRALLAADKAKRAADLSGRAADAWQQEAELLHSNVAHAISAIGSILGGLVSKLGQLGDVVQAGISGFQQGGWWGAILAVLADIFSKFKGFQSLVDLGTAQLNQLLKQLTPALTALTSGVKEFMVASGVVTQIVGEVVGPAIRELGRMFSHIFSILTPILSVVRTAIEPIIDIISAFEDLLGSVDILQPIIKVVAVVFNAISLTILETMNGLETAWDGILSVVIGFLHLIHADATGVETLRAEVDSNLAAIRSKAASISKDMANPNVNADVADDGKKGAAGQQTKSGQFAAASLKNVGTAAEKAASGLAKMTGQLTNVPEGFKVQLRTFQALQASGAWGGSGHAVNIEKVEVKAANMADLYSELMKVHRRKKGG